jgi:hypothetical protein
MSGYIYLCPLPDVPAANAQAVVNEFGPDTLSVELFKTIGGADWRGTHSWVDLLALAPTQWNALPIVVVNYVGDDPVAAWNQALIDNGLEQPPYPPI